MTYWVRSGTEVLGNSDPALQEFLLIFTLIIHMKYIIPLRRN